MVMAAKDVLWTVLFGFAKDKGHGMVKENIRNLHVWR